MLNIQFDSENGCIVALRSTGCNSFLASYPAHNPWIPGSMRLSFAQTRVRRNFCCPSAKENFI